MEKISSHLNVRGHLIINHFCFEEKSSVGQVAFAGVTASTRGKNVEFALETAYSEQVMKFRARLNYLSMVVTLSPLLGLLGTISEMIETLNTFSVQAGQPLAIGEALIATATGLCVAIFALIVHILTPFFYDNKI